MLNTVIFDNSARIWWDYLPLRKKGDTFVVYVNGKKYSDSEKTHVKITNLNPETTLSVKVELVSPSGELKTVVGQTEITTLKAKIRLDVTKAPYGAVGDGNTINTKAIQKALDDCTKNHCVYIPNGTYMTGALYLHSDTELLLEDKAVLQGTTDMADYLPMKRSRFEGIEQDCYASLINVGKLDHTKGCTTQNVIIRGGSILGGGQELRKSIIETEAQKLIPTLNLKEGERPSALYASIIPGRYRGRLLEVCNTKNFVIADCEAGFSPAWNLQFVYSEDIVTCGCKVISHGISNGDGWDPDSSKNCIVFDTYFDTGDDCVAIKSGKNPEGNVINRPTEHVRVFDIYSKGGHGICLGSEMSGGINDVKIWDCDIENSFAGFHYKTIKERGGYLKNICVYDSKTSKIHVDNRMQSNNDGQSSVTPPVLENFVFDNVSISGIELYNEGRTDKANAVVVSGYEGEFKLKGLVLRNITLKYRVMNPWHQFFLNDVENVTIENIICK